MTSGSGQFVGVGKDGLIVTSPNGVDWSAIGTDEAATLYSVAYGNNRFVAVGTNGFTHMSIDGAHWPATQINGVAGFRRVAFSNGIFVALTSTNNIVFASRDGVTWDSKQITAFNLYGLDASDDELWLVGDRSTILRTSLSPARAPTLRAALDQSKKFVLTVQPAEAANYQIESSPTLIGPSWETQMTFSNLQSPTNWTDTNAPGPMKFYRALRQ